MENCLIAYYSRKGNNYLNGRIVNLPVGNTELIARKIQRFTGGRLFEIITVNKYPEDYTETTVVARNELRQKARPELSGLLPSIDNFDTIFLGYPNWWNTMPMAVFTFLESYDFNGKVIAPFCTHEGSGIGRSEKDIRSLCEGSTILPGLALRGSAASAADTEVSNWIMNNKLIKI